MVMAVVIMLMTTSDNLACAIVQVGLEWLVRLQRLGIVELVEFGKVLFVLIFLNHFKLNQYNSTIIKYLTRLKDTDTEPSTVQQRFQFRTFWWFCFYQQIDLLHKFKMRCNELLVKKIDLRERVNLHNKNQAPKVAQASFPLQKKLRHPSFQTLRAKQSSKMLASNVYPEGISKELGRQSRSQGGRIQHHTRNRFSRQQDKTYNNNYKLFPKRSFLRSSYVVESSNIIIDIFSKKVEFEERRNDFLARSLSLGLKNCSEKIFASEKPKPIKQISLQSSKRIRLSFRASSAIEPSKPRYPKVERFTPWQVQTLEFNQQIPQRL